MEPTTQNGGVTDEGAFTSNLSEPLLPSGSDPSSDSTESDTDLNRDVVIKCCGKTRVRMNHNVFLNLVLAFMYGVSDSLWGGTVFAAYLKKLGGGYNGPVGSIEAVNGLAVLISALPVGFLADKLGRSKVIRAGGILLAVTATLHIAVLEWIGVDASHADTEVNMVLLGIVMALWGIGGGMISGPCQALYADSTPAGSRSKYYQYLFACYMLASIMGPTISIILFQTLGDDWDLRDLRTVCYVGLGLEFVNALLMVLFDDRKALDEGGDSSSGSRSESDQPPLETIETNTTDSGSDRELLITNQVSNISEDIDGAHRATETEDFIDEPHPSAPLSGEQRQLPPPQQNYSKYQGWIPYVMFASGSITSIGSGMTVKFFPLFFKDEVGMTPTQVQIVYVLVPVVMIILSQCATWVSSWFGRVQTSTLVSVVGVACLYCMVFFSKFLDAHKWVLVPIYVLRTGLMNCPYPLQESILMDFVPKDTRARWKSLESIQQFGWCGSAALGGWISDRWDYSRTFLVTAIIQSMGILLFATLMPLVPRRERDMAMDSDSSSSVSSAPSSSENESA